jgi:hypothetical protein
MKKTTTEPAPSATQDALDAALANATGGIVPALIGTAVVVGAAAWVCADLKDEWERKPRSGIEKMAHDRIGRW